jgi:hypothetical protein
VARLWPLIRALAADQSRAFRSYGRVAKNNLAGLALLLAVLSPMAASLLLMVLCLPMLAASQREPTALGLERLALLPLTRGDQVLIAAAGIAAEPLIWLLLGLVLLGGSRVWGLAGALVAIALLAKLIFAWGRKRLRPLGAQFPTLPGRFGPFLASFIQAPLRTLDFYAALLLALAGWVYRLSETTPNPTALAAISLLVVVAFSTYAQTLFDLEGPEGLARFRLLPLPGWKLLLLKDAAYLLVLLPLLLPLAPVVGCAAALGALAAGHAASVKHPSHQAPWHFMNSASLGHGLAQGALILALGSLAHRLGTMALLPGLFLLAISLAWYGRSLDATRG